MNKIKKVLFILLYVIISVLIITAVDIDFGVFNYKGSRLKKIELYNVKCKNKLSTLEWMEYQYDEKGYLIGRIFSESDRSTIEYDLSNNKIIEKVDRKTGYNKPMPIFFEYYYDKNNRLINYKRFDSNTKNEEMKLSRDVVIEYNEKSDITAIYDKQGISVYSRYWPGCDLGITQEGYFKYEYKDNMKIKYIKLSPNKEYNNSAITEYLYENKNLIKIIEYAKKEKNLIFMRTNLKYDERGNIIETLLEYFNLYKNPGTLDNTLKYTYEYDEKNRLIVKNFYNYSDSGRGKYRVEKFIYEDGPYVHFPYLLPTTKIIIYHPASSNEGIDKSIY